MSDANHSKMTLSDVPIAVAVTFPFCILIGTGVAAILHLLGVHQGSGPAIASVIAIIVSMQIFLERMINPSKKLKVAAAIAWIIVAFIVWAAQTNRIDLS